MRVCSELDRLPDADIGPAPADVAAHGVVDVGVAWVRSAGEQRRGRHDLPELAVAALDHLMIEPGLLDSRTRRCRADRLDRRDRGCADAVDAGDAGACGDAVDMHGAGAAEARAATEFGSGH